MLEKKKDDSKGKCSVASIRFINLLECGKMRNHHVRLYSISERDGGIPDYSSGQEQHDLENYKGFINSSAYDDIRDVETEMRPKTGEILSYIRKIGALHDDV